jgi:UDP-N-acetylmuramate: L-alanyl-gamma-D-glutamyl-meso-diaminopimelate ligase
MLKHRGHDVSGSDEQVYPPMSDFLAAERITVLEGYRPEHVQGAIDLVVVGNAISRGNEELEAVLEAGLRYASLPETIRDQWLWDAQSIVIAGTHGKTTTTAITGWLLTSAGADPTVLVGGIARNFGTDGASYRLGKGRAFVIEGDEYDSAYFDKRPKFLHYRPSSAIVTSVEFDHADIYAGWDDYLEAFREFVRLVPREGLLALCADDPVLSELSAEASARVVWYGSDPADVTARDLRPGSDGQRFTLVRDGSELGELDLRMSGRYNLLNALAVSAVALDEGLPIEDLRRGLATFTGVKRRQQLLGEAGGVAVIDDFAHHPTAVRATLGAVAERFPGRRIVAVFEPRTNSSRRKVFESGYTEALAAADAVYLSSPPFRHNDDPSDFMDIEKVVDDLELGGSRSIAREGADALLPEIVAGVRPGDVVVIMSNGGFGGIHLRLLAALGG